MPVQMAFSIRQQIFHVLTETDSDNALSQLDDIVICVLVLVDVGVFILETSQSVVARFGWLLQGLETLVVLTFSLEYVLRLWACTIAPRYRHPLWGRVRYALTPLAIVDLAAILPYFVLLLAANAGAVLPASMFRLFRLFRFVRFLKIGRYSDSLKNLMRGISSKSEELLLAFAFVVALLVFSSSLMYFAEHEAQPDAFPSIPAAMWWGVVTLTTVGYGDVYPITPLGKLFGAVLAFLGIGMFALPAGIVASSFTEEFERRKLRKQASETESDPSSRNPQVTIKDTRDRSLAELKQVAIALEISEELETPAEGDWQARIDRNAQMLQYCLQAARQQTGGGASEESVRSLAMLLFVQAVRDED